MTETQNDVIRRRKKWKNNITMRKKQGNSFDIENNGYKVLRKYLEVLTLQKKIKICFTSKMEILQ